MYNSTIYYVTELAVLVNDYSILHTDISSGFLPTQARSMRRKARATHKLVLSDAQVFGSQSLDITPHSIGKLKFI